MPTAVEDVCNRALQEIGFPGAPIGDIYEGSPQSNAALQIYGQTRDEILRAQDFHFARGNAPLVLLKGPPPAGGYNAFTPWSALYPPPGYLYEYGYPSDCLELLDVDAPSWMPALDPRPVDGMIYNDPLPIVSGAPLAANGPPQKVFCCNLAGAVGVYRRRVTDLTLWEADAVGLLIATLARKLASSPLLAASADQQKMLPQEVAVAAQVADMHRG